MSESKSNSSQDPEIRAPQARATGFEPDIKPECGRVPELARVPEFARVPQFARILGIAAPKLAASVQDEGPKLGTIRSCNLVRACAPRSIMSAACAAHGMYATGGGYTLTGREYLAANGGAGFRVANARTSPLAKTGISRLVSFVSGAALIQSVVLVAALGFIAVGGRVSSVLSDGLGVYLTAGPAAYERDQLSRRTMRELRNGLAARQADRREYGVPSARRGNAARGIEGRSAAAYASMIGAGPATLSRVSLPIIPIPLTQTRDVEVKVGRGDSWAAVWEKAGAERSAGMQAERACRLLDPKRCNLIAGEAMRFRLDSSSQIREMERDLSNGELLYVSRANTSGYQANVIVPRFIEAERTVSGWIDGTFSESANQMGLPYQLVDDLVDLFGDRIDFKRDLRDGDLFTVVYNERQSADGRVKNQPQFISAASFQIGGKTMVAVRHRGKNGQAIYFNERGEQLGNFFLRYPLTFSRISSMFTTSRFHPVLGKKRAHNGVDFSAPTGTPVRAVSDGEILISGYKGGAGNMVRIKHCDRYTTEYFHLSRIASGLKAGLKVRRGQVIGSVGSTGLSTAPHLHFGFFDRGKYVDPLSVKLPRSGGSGDVIPAEQLKKTLLILARQMEQTKVALEKSEAARLALAGNAQKGSRA